jgi:predicted CoA-binding protein
MPIEDDAAIKEILKRSKAIAVVGASPKPGRDSGTIADYLARRGYNVIPVNPAYPEIFGMKCFPDLTSIGAHVDIVDIFRRPDEVMPIVEEAIKIHAGTVWMQLDVVNEDAARRAEEAGLNVIMDRCIAVEFRRLVQ